MNPPAESHTDLLPLREPTFFILLSLVPGSKHGYAILKDVEELSHGKVKLSTGTLYEALARLLDQGLIERIEPDKAEDENDQDGTIHRGKTRRSYCLTKTGHRLIEAELQRMHSLIAIAQQQLGLERQEG
jgi:DNA-binding PadR family transcriptional regulator